MRRALVLLLAVPCGITSAPDTSKQTEAAKPSGQSPLPDIRSVSQRTVFRKSDTQGPSGYYLPPWKEVKLDLIGFDEKPETGRNVTVVPLGVSVAPIQLKILKTRRVQDPCDNKLPGYWEVELEQITQKEFFEFEPAHVRKEIAFDACVIYPAVESARSLSPQQLTKEMLPEGISVNTVTAAIDLTNDQEPDLLIAYYCCDDTTRPREECDYTCGKEFKRTAGGWKLMDEHGPC